MSDDPPFFTLPDLVRKRIGCRSALYEAMNAGLLRAHKLGARTVIFPEDLRDYLANLPCYKAGGVPHLVKARAAQSAEAPATSALESEPTNGA